ncbi:MAG: hypothetical protein J0I58_15345 [Mesorhizobium sp.]|nr:hypothetical protein [Mesorhizobium sp.]
MLAAEDQDREAAILGTVCAGSQAPPCAGWVNDDHAPAELEQLFDGALRGESLAGAGGADDRCRVVEVPGDIHQDGLAFKVGICSRTLPRMAVSELSMMRTATAAQRSMASSP